MPPRVCVRKLRDLSRDHVMERLCTIVLEDIYFSDHGDWDSLDFPLLTTRLQTVRDILVSSIRPPIMEEILTIISQKGHEIEPNIRYLAMQLLLVKGIHTLIVGHFPEHYYSAVLEAIAESAVDIQRLDLSGLWVRDADKFYLHKVLRRINSIRHLVLRYVCDDETLSVIGKHCTSLERLDISGSPAITLDGVKTLVENPARSCAPAGIGPSLQIVDIGGPGALKLPVPIAIELLMKLPHLKSLGGYERVGAALESIFQNYPDKTLKLQYLHDVHTKSSAILAITKTCPELRAVYLDSPGGVALQHLHLFQKLTELKLNKVKATDLSILLGKCGHRIRSLVLLSVWGSMDLVSIGEQCPELVRVELHNIALKCGSTSHPVALRKVKEMFIFSTQITTACIKLIFNQAVRVEHLSLGECKELTDAAVLCSLMDHSLRKVHSIWLALAGNLTMRTVEGLIDKCPSLTSLGNLSAWDVRPFAVALLREQLLLSNTDLNLHELGPGEEPEGDFVQIYAV